MKKINTVLNIVLIIAVIILFWLFFNKNGKETATAKQTTEDSTANMVNHFPIAYVNSDSIMDKYKLVLDMKEDFKNQTEAFQTKLESKMKKFQADVQKFQKDARYMVPAEVEKKRKQYMARQDAITNMRDELSKKLANKQDTMNIVLKKKVTDLLKKNKKELQYNIVLGYSEIGNILYADSMMNITDQVIKELNAQYDAAHKDTDKEK